MLRLLIELAHGDSGQDMTEYGLLLAFVVLASAALFLGTDKSVLGIWSTNANMLTAANSFSSPS